MKSFSGLDANSVANGSIVLAQTNQGKARAIIGLNPKLKWAVPGPWSELWVDNYAIVKNAPDLDQAYDFLNYQLQPEVQLAEPSTSDSRRHWPAYRRSCPPTPRTPT